mgnify:CR=1 FL=1|jgi:hypothetical protein
MDWWGAQISFYYFRLFLFQTLFLLQTKKTKKMIIFVAFFAKYVTIYAVRKGMG